MGRGTKPGPLAEPAANGQHGEHALADRHANHPGQHHEQGGEIALATDGAGRLHRKRSGDGAHRQAALQHVGEIQPAGQQDGAAHRHDDGGHHPHRKREPVPTNEPAILVDGHRKGHGRRPQQPEQPVGFGHVVPVGNVEQQDHRHQQGGCQQQRHQGQDALFAIEPLAGVVEDQGQGETNEAEQGIRHGDDSGGPVSARGDRPGPPPGPWCQAPAWYWPVAPPWCATPPATAAPDSWLPPPRRARRTATFPPAASGHRRWTIRPWPPRAGCRPAATACRWGWRGAECAGYARRYRPAARWPPAGRFGMASGTSECRGVSWQASFCELGHSIERDQTCKKWI